MPKKNKENKVVAKRPINGLKRRTKKKAAVATRSNKRGRTKRVALGNWNIRTAAADVMISENFTFYSPQLSTDYLELPRSLQEKREWFRHFYHKDELVGRSIDLHTDLPLSKLTLTLPPSKDSKKAHYILKFYQNMCERLQLFKRLLEITHEYNIIGNVFIFLEDGEGLEEGEHEVLQYEINEIDRELMEGEDVEETPEEKDSGEKFEEKNPKYKGWERIVILPPDQIHLRTFSFTDEVQIELVPDSTTRNILMQANAGDPEAIRIAESIPEEIRMAILQGTRGAIPLDTDPELGSYCYHLARKKSQYEDLGSSVLERCLRTLLYRDKLRQAQTQIADRHLTPIHLIWAEGLSVDDVEDLREQVDLSLMDPDYSIVTNYEVHWQDVGAQERLLNLGTEYEETEKRLLAGLGVTKELLTGEATWGGTRIGLEIMNTHYLLYRELLQDFVEEGIFKPVAKRKGFVEKDEFGNDILLYPKLRFSRLALRDHTETYEALFNLYQKGSLPVDVIYDLFNLDRDDIEQKLRRDLFTLSDANMNEAVRGILGGVVEKILENTKAIQKIAENLGLEYKEPELKEEEEKVSSRFANTKKGKNRITISKGEYQKFLEWREQNGDGKE